jgi:hypothetical protein
VLGFVGYLAVAANACKSGPAPQRSPGSLHNGPVAPLATSAFNVYNEDIVVIYPAFRNMTMSLPCLLLLAVTANSNACKGTGGDASGDFFGGGGTKAGSATSSGSGSGSAEPVVAAGSAAALPLVPSIATIKLTLLKNWQRDAKEPGTFSIVLPVASGDVAETAFAFEYGVEPDGTPTAREAYKAWLGTQAIMLVEKERQRGSTWFLEGKNATGHPMFRSFVKYGNRIIFCGGSAYKDGDQAKLGELRDQVLIQAKQICETVTM